MSLSVIASRRAARRSAKFSRSISSERAEAASSAAAASTTGSLPAWANPAWTRTAIDAAEPASGIAAIDQPTWARLGGVPGCHAASAIATSASDHSVSSQLPLR